MKLETIYCTCLAEMTSKEDLGLVRIYECPECHKRNLVLLSNGEKIAKLEKKLKDLKSSDKNTNNEQYYPCPKCGKMIEGDLEEHLKTCEGFQPKQKTSPKRRGPGRPKKTDNTNIAPKKKGPGRPKKEFDPIPKHVIEYAQLLNHEKKSAEIEIKPKITINPEEAI